MTRQWLALIALLTGLAAVGAPVNAQAAEALSCEIGASAEVCSDTAATIQSARFPHSFGAKRDQNAAVNDKPNASQPAPKAVMIEVDRAHK